jgi:hypothetical protein
MDGLGGLYRTINTGANWQAASRGLPPGAWVTTLVVHPRRPERIFAGVRYATADHPQAYVFESDDIGLSWRSVSLGMHVLPNNDGSVTGLAWSKDTLFASTASDGLYSFNEQTKNWTRAALPPHKDATTPVSGKPEQQPIRVASLATDNSGRLYISTQQGVYRSDDKAASWQEFGPSAASSTAALAVDSSTGRALAASGSQGWAYNLAATGIAGTPAAVAQAVPPTPASQVGGIPSVVAQLGITPSTGDEEPTPPALPTATLAPVPPTATVVPATATPPPPQRPTGYLPSDPAEPLDASFSSYVPETKHNIQHGFRDYWLGINGVILLGYPLTEEFEENGATVQYFERGRLEYRDGKVQLGRLGAELTEGRFFQTVRFFVSEETKAYFGPTQHSVTGPFLITWRDLGGLATLGYPLSESFEQGDGHEYQYFERGRLEWHRDLPEGPKIVLGQLGREALERRGWLK